MNNETKQNRKEQGMNYQTKKLIETQNLGTPLSTTLGAPMYSSPWVALYLHLKANFNQSSAP